jgi:hypothetical protein
LQARHTSSRAPLALFSPSLFLRQRGGHGQQQRLHGGGCQQERAHGPRPQVHGTNRMQRNALPAGCALPLNPPPAVSRDIVCQVPRGPQRRRVLRVVRGSFHVAANRPQAPHLHLLLLPIAALDAPQLCSRIAWAPVARRCEIERARSINLAAACHLLSSATARVAAAEKPRENARFTARRRHADDERAATRYQCRSIPPPPPSLQGVALMRCSRH